MLVAATGSASDVMGARQQLNRVILLACAGAAVAAWAVSESWWASGVVLGASLAAALANNDLRLGRVHRRAWRLAYR